MAAAGAKAPDAHQGMEEPGTPTARAGSPRTAPDNDSKSVPLNYSRSPKNPALQQLQ